MPRRDGSQKRTACVWLVCSLFAFSPVQAQDQEESRSAEAMIARANEYYGLGRRPKGCQPGSGGEILVCGRFAPDPRFEPVDPLPTEPKMVALGAPPVGRGVGVGVVMRLCILQKCPKPLYLIDLKAIPEPPPGSDAEMIALGLMPAR